jgi:hypothetical protein
VRHSSYGKGLTGTDLLGQLAAGTEGAEGGSETGNYIFNDDGDGIVAFNIAGSLLLIYTESHILRMTYGSPKRILWNLEHLLWFTSKQIQILNDNTGFHHTPTIIFATEAT